MEYDDNPWLYHGLPIDGARFEGFVGFVYVIHNLETSRRYVGKKLLQHRRTKIVKGKRKRSLVESDWKTYWGSSVELLEDIKRLGHHRFMREIIHLCRSKTELSYMELREQVDRRVLESDKWYNNYIMVRIRGSQL
jgi:hypothetical protein